MGLTHVPKKSLLPKAFFIIIVVLGLTTPAHIFAQDVVMLEGKVLNDSIDASFLHIVNLSLQKGTITNEGGSFIIPVRVNDTLYISAIQFKNRELIVTPEIYSRKKVSLHLEEEVSELEEVNVSNIDLSGRLGEDLNVPKVEKPFDPAAAGLPVYTGPIITVEERRLYTATHSANGKASVDALINAISGRTKTLKKYVAISNMENRVQKARSKFVDSIYIKQLEIPSKLIDDFAHYVYLDNEATLAMAEKNDPLALIEMLIIKAPSYLKLKEKVEE